MPGRLCRTPELLTDITQPEPLIGIRGILGTGRLQLPSFLIETF
jgi:hypothetical protein